MSNINDNFTKIYVEGLWGKQDDNYMSQRKNKIFYSGGGTDHGNDKNDMYRNLLQSYVNKDDVKTVVEIGCGDWEVSSRIDWSSVSYTGYDVAKIVVDYNNENFSKNNIKFICDDIISKNTIKSDLLIVKDVFQHLPASFCKDFIQSITSNFKYNIITNDFGVSNNDIDFGDYQGNNFSLSPFYMKYDLLIQWVQKFTDAGNKQTITFKN